MKLSIDGVDITPYIAFGGVGWKREDLDGPNTGRGLDGTLFRDRVATKIRLDVTCRPLTTEEAKIVLTVISSEWIEVTYTDPSQGGEVTKTMYSNNNPATFMMRDTSGIEYWSGITFPLIEK